MYAIEISENEDNDFYLVCFKDDYYYEVELDGEDAEVVGKTDEESFEKKVDEGADIISFGDMDINVIQAVESDYYG